MSYQVFYTKKALEDIPKLKSAKLDTKAKNLISLIKNNPYQTPPPYEKLKGILQGAYSRRINIKHRLVYEVIEEKQGNKNYQSMDSLRILTLLYLGQKMSY